MERTEDPSVQDSREEQKDAKSSSTHSAVPVNSVPAGPPSAPGSSAQSTPSSAPWTREEACDLLNNSSIV
jgi:hypothetical protein